MSPDGAALYVTLNGEGTVAKIDAASGTVETKVRTGQRAAQHGDLDGRQASLRGQLRVGHDERARRGHDGEVQDVQTGYHPIGMTYDRRTGDVWVANYTGSIMIFAPSRWSPPHRVLRLDRDGCSALGAPTQSTRPVS